MKITLNRGDDALYIRFDPTAKIIESEEVEPGVVLDFDDAGRVVAIEVLSLSERVPASSPVAMDVETV